MRSVFLLFLLLSLLFSPSCTTSPNKRHHVIRLSSPKGRPKGYPAAKKLGNGTSGGRKRVFHNKKGSRLPEKKLPITAPTGGSTIRYALETLFKDAPSLYQDVHTKMEREEKYGLTSTASILRQLCEKYMVCSMNGRKYELENIIIHKGVIYLNEEADQQSIRSLTGLDSGRLPPHQIFDKWKKGLRFQPGPTVKLLKSLPPEEKELLKCTKNNTYMSTLYVHYPFHIGNGFHALNDNTVSIVLHILLQHVLDPKPFTEHRTLFLFTETYRRGGMLFDLLLEIFDRDIQSANSLFHGRPFCVKRLSWSSPIKIFYKNNLSGLLYLTYKFIQLSLSKRMIQQPKHFMELSPAAKGFYERSLVHRLDSKKSAAETFQSTEKLRAVIVSRNSGKTTKASSRSLAKYTEETIRSMLEEQGIEATICSFAPGSELNQMNNLWKLFSRVDICIGVHGAGLGNCILMPEGGLVVELQALYAFGSDLFLKMAHMSRATYVHFNIKPRFKMHQHLSIPQNQLDDLLETIKVIILAKDKLPRRNASSLRDDPTRLVDHLSHIREVYNQYLPSKKLSEISNRHIRVGPFLMVFPPPDIVGDYNSLVRGPTRERQEQECLDSVYYFFQKTAIGVKGVTPQICEQQ